jgi:hypothetical protein
VVATARAAARQTVPAQPQVTPEPEGVRS